jgi:hypothetical protein
MFRRAHNYVFVDIHIAERLHLAALRNMPNNGGNVRRWIWPGRGRQLRARRSFQGFVLFLEIRHLLSSIGFEPVVMWLGSSARNEQISDQ